MNDGVRQALAGRHDLGLPPLKLGMDANPYEQQMQKQLEPYTAGLGGEFTPFTPFNTMPMNSVGANAPQPLGGVKQRLATPY